MAKDLFRLYQDAIYPDVPYTYSTGAEINRPEHAAGVKFEAFLQERFGGGGDDDKLQPSPKGQLSPAFLHCEGSMCFVDKTTMSKESPDQVKIALDLLVDFVRGTGVSASRLVILSPYKANVEQIERQRKLPLYSSLSGMPPAATVDSFQGREGYICVVVMGTTKRVGPGFTLDEQRLNVMLSRQRCGLLIVGDIHVSGEMNKGKGKGKGKGKAQDYKVPVVGSDGKRTFVKARMLHKVHKALWEAGRVFTIKVPPKEKAEA